MHRAKIFFRSPELEVTKCGRNRQLTNGWRLYDQRCRFLLYRGECRCNRCGLPVDHDLGGFR